MSRIRICRATFFSAGAALLLAACGQPGAPLRPSANLPAPPTDFSVTRSGPSLTLQWSSRHLTSDGVALKGPATARLCAWRQGAAPVGSSCPVGLRLAPTPPGVTPGARGRGAAGRGGTPVDAALPVARLLAAGLPAAPVSLCLSLINAQGQAAGCSNPVVVSLIAVAPAPLDLRALALPEGIQLTWSAPSPAAAAIHVYRQPETAKANTPPVQVANLAGGSGTWLDRDVTLGTSYRYFARSAAGPIESEVESEDSIAVTAQAGDYVPPAPSGLRVLTSAAPEGGADLTWEISDLPGLAGYNVYRQSGSGAWAKLNATPLQTPVYHDEPPAGEVRYRVTAVTLSGREGAPSAAVAFAQLPPVEALP